MPPGASLPSRSAASIMRSAMRSLTEPPGFMYSTLTSTSLVAATPSVTDLQPNQGRVPHHLGQRVVHLHVHLSLASLHARAGTAQTDAISYGAVAAVSVGVTRHEEAHSMPEAVIVATARSPIGRAFKGSLTSIRPDDLLAQIVSAALAKVPAAGPRRGRRPDRRLRPARRRAGLQHRPGGRGPARLRHAAGHHGQPLLLILAADHADGLSRHQGGRGRRVHLGRRRVRLPRREGVERLLARHEEPAVRDGAGADGATAEAESAVARSARRRRATRRLHRDGRRPRRTSPRCAASRAPSRTSSASGRRTWRRRRSPTASGSGRSPR